MNSRIPTGTLRYSSSSQKSLPVLAAPSQLPFPGYLAVQIFIMDQEELTRMIKSYLGLHSLSNRYLFYIKTWQTGPDGNLTPVR